MPLVETAATLATLVGLLSNWKSERSGVATDQFQDFLIYLTNHNFEVLREQIIASGEIQRELHDLLLQDSALVSEKLNVVCQGMASLSEKIDVLAPLARSFRLPHSELSDQAVEILKIFSQSGASRMIVFKGGKFFGFQPTGGKFGLDDTRFVEDDLAMLLAFDFLRISDRNSNGDPIYTMTRAGAEFVKAKPEVRREDGRLVGEKHP